MYQFYTKGHHRFLQHHNIHRNPNQQFHLFFDKLLNAAINYKNDRATYRLTVNPQKGDANADGTVDVEDVVAIVNQILGSPSDAFNISASDINGDGQIDVEDVVGTVNIILSGGSK